jgi:hypothetical protein
VEKASSVVEVRKFVYCNEEKGSSLNRQKAPICIFKMEITKGIQFLMKGVLLFVRTIHYQLMSLSFSKEVLQSF